MTAIRQRLENGFESFACMIFENKFKVIGLTVMFIGILVSNIPNITIDTTTEGFLHENDPIRIDYEQFRDRFGTDELAIVALEPKSVFDLVFLEKLKRLHEDLEQNLPFLDEVTSLINARNTFGQKDELIVEDLLVPWPKGQKDLEKIKARAMGNPMYKNLLLSEDGKFTTMVIRSQTYSGDLNDESDDLAGFEENTELDLSPLPAQANTPESQEYLTDVENSIFIKALEEIVDRHRSDEFKVYIAGTPVVDDFLKRSMMENMRKFMGIAIVTIALFLYALFRRFSGVLLPMLIVVISLVSTVGLMALFKVPIKLPTQILPSFLLSVSVGASVHVLVMFFQRFDSGGPKKDAIAYALGHSGLAIVMTSLTTAAGLLSFSTAEVAPIADLGIFAASGILLSLVYTLIFLPSLLSIIPVKAKQKGNGREKGGIKKSSMDTMIHFCTRVSTIHPGKVLVTALLIALVAIMGIPKIKLSHDPLRWFPDDNPVRQSTEKLDSALKGTTSVEVIIDTATENGLYDPTLLNQLEKSADLLESYIDENIFVGKAWSITAVVKETNQALHENDPAFYTIPQTRDLVAQELFLFENSGSDDLEDFTDSQFSTIRFTMKVPFVDAIAYTDLMDRVTAHFSEHYADHDITITGLVAMLARVLSNTIYSMLKSYGVALIVITFLMMVLIGRIRIGMVSMIPNLFPIVLMLGVMGWLNFPMDLFCMMVASIAIGLAVDDTIHFMHNFRRYYEQTHDPVTAISNTLNTTGRAMMVTTCVLSIGFFTFMFSEMSNLHNFGLLTGFTLIMALLADYFIAPALMVLLHSGKIQVEKKLAPEIIS